MAKTKKTKKTPKSIQQSIPMVNVYKNGVIETHPGVFTRAYRIPDVDFKISSEEVKNSVFHAYEGLINLFKPGTWFQICIRNQTIDKREFLRAVHLEAQRDGLNGLRKEMTGLQVQAIGRGAKSLRQTKTLIVSVHADSVDKAMQEIESYDKAVTNAMQKIAPLSPLVKPMSLEERLQDIFDIYNQDGTNVLANSEKDGVPVFDIGVAYTQGLSIKDCIAPGGMRFESDSFRTGGTYGIAHFLGKAPVTVTPEFLGDLMSLPYRFTISIQMQIIHKTKMVKMVKNALLNVGGSIAEDQKTAGMEGYSAALIGASKYDTHAAFTELMDRLTQENQNGLALSMIVSVFGNTKEDATTASAAVMDVGQRHFFPLQPLITQQEEGFQFCLPLCVDGNGLRKQYARQYLTETAATLLPFTSQEMHMTKGLWYGMNKLTHNPIIHARNAPTEKNANAIIVGAPGGGKSFTAKYEMLSCLLRSPKNVVYVIDPKGEYAPIVGAVNGTAVRIGANTRTYLNPMDMDINYGDSVNVAMQNKSAYLISLMEIINNGIELTPQDKSVIDRCVTAVYEPYIRHIQAKQKIDPSITNDKDAAPRLRDLHAKLQEQPDGQYLASILQMYANGNQNIFAFRSNVNTDARMLVYDISMIGSGTMLPLSLFVALNDIQMKTMENKKKGLWTWIYIDEFHRLTKSYAATEFLGTCWRMYRSMNGVLTAISQSISDMPDDIISTSNMCILLSTPDAQERQFAADMYKLSDKQLEYIYDVDKGSGLIVCGGGRMAIPFENPIPASSQIFELFNSTQMEY